MNSSIVIALPKIDDARKIRTILNRHGFPVAAVCSTASTALASMSELDGGILICGYKLPDRYYRDVLEDLPSCFEMLLLASQRVTAEAPDSILTIEMPMKTADLVNTVDMMLNQIERRLRREKKKGKEPKTAPIFCKIVQKALDGRRETVLSSYLPVKEGFLFARIRFSARGGERPFNLKAGRQSPAPTPLGTE